LEEIYKSTFAHASWRSHFAELHSCFVAESLRRVALMLRGGVTSQSRNTCFFYFFSLF